MEWLSNYWVIGAGGGVISGLLVTLVIRHLYAGREQREYQLKIAAANNEIIQAIRPAVAERVIPSSSMLDALFSATARKYGVNSGDLLPKAGCVNELMKEVIDNTFLSSQQKVEFCELLAGMKRPEGETLHKRPVEVVTVIRRADLFDPSALLGLTAALMATMLTTSWYLRDTQEFLLGGQPMKLLPILAIVTVTPILAYLLIDLVRQVLRHREGESGAAPVPAASAPPVQELGRLEHKPLQPTS